LNNTYKKVVILKKKIEKNEVMRYGPGKPGLMPESQRKALRVGPQV